MPPTCRRIYDSYVWPNLEKFRHTTPTCKFRIVKNVRTMSADKVTMSAATAPQDDVDTKYPCHPCIDMEWPLPASGYDPDVGFGWVGVRSHLGTQFCKRVWRGVCSTARHYGAKSWESEGAICIPKSTNYHNTHIFVFCIPKSTACIK